jgi:hypothetical protein
MAYIPNLDEGLHDADLQLCSAQAIPTDGANDRSTNILDLVVTNPVAGRVAKIPEVKIEITTDFAVASGTPYLDIRLLTCATAGTIGACSDVGYIGAIPSTADKGDVFSFPIPREGLTTLLRYLALALVPRDASTLFSAGAINAWFVT